MPRSARLFSGTAYGGKGLAERGASASNAGKGCRWAMRTRQKKRRTEHDSADNTGRWTHESGVRSGNHLEAEAAGKGQRYARCLRRGRNAKRDRKQARQRERLLAGQCA